MRDGITLRRRAAAVTPLPYEVLGTAFLVFVITAVGAAAAVAIVASLQDTPQVYSLPARPQYP